MSLAAHTKRRVRALCRRVGHWRNARCDAAPKLLLLLYHRVLPRVTFNPLDTMVPLDVFTHQLDVVARRYPIIPLETAVAQACERRPRAPVQVVLTFDDGYWDNFDIVYPLLKHRGWPAAFFLPTQYIGGRRPLWDWEVLLRLRHAPDIGVQVGEARLTREPREEPLTFARRVMEALKAASQEAMDEALEGLRRRTQGALSSEALDDRCLTWEQARRLASDGMAMGAHSVSHRSLARIPLAEAVTEVRMSKQVIEEQLGMPCRHFALPFGSPRDYTPEILAQVQAAGFETCLLNIHGYNRLDNGSAHFKRIVMTQTTHPEHLLG